MQGLRSPIGVVLLLLLLLLLQVIIFVIFLNRGSSSLGWRCPTGLLLLNRNGARASGGRSGGQGPPIRPSRQAMNHRGIDGPNLPFQHAVGSSYHIGGGYRWDGMTRKALLRQTILGPFRDGVQGKPNRAVPRRRRLCVSLLCCGPSPTRLL